MIFVKALLGAIPAALLCWPNPAAADNAAAQAAGELDAIVVTAKKRPDPVADEVLTKKVEAALLADPYLLDDHVTVTTKNGIVTLEGIVFDEWDVRMAMRIARKTAGVRRVVTDFYIPDGQ
jgi:hyperosmotically inducible periplasmic protein